MGGGGLQVDQGRGELFKAAKKKVLSYLPQVAQQQYAVVRMPPVSVSTLTSE
ncbi:hypothetical protein [Rubidibacter lacunae]|uniref:hypothetical protein n=1 Tax=Rubidibacter lacunae TaxID=582514 RepID=UPI00040CA415